LLHVYGEDYRHVGNRESLHPPHNTGEIQRIDAALNLINRPQPPHLPDVPERSSQPLTAQETEYLLDRGWLDNHITSAEEQYLEENGLGLG
jgi:hypothetical protein